MDKDGGRVLLNRIAERAVDLSVRGKAMPYLSVNGNMFAFADEDGLALRLTRKDRAAWAAEGHDDRNVIKYNAVMQGYVRVPDTLGQNDAAFADWAARCVAGARALPPKPTKKGK